MNKVIALLLALCLLLCTAAAVGESALPAGVKVLPMDFSGGMPARAEGFLSEYEYEDPSIHVVISSGRYKETDYWQADITIADASQLRTVSADGFDSNLTDSAVSMAESVNAILSMAGDYYCYSQGGYILRQGELYEHYIRGVRDVLAIDEDGNFHAVLKADSTMLNESLTYEGHKLVNAFFFGPALIVNGAERKGGADMFTGPDKRSQRSAICQVGPLTYRVVCTGSLKRGSRGMLLDEFRAFLADNYDDIIVAYNMDGGDSTQLLFNCVKVNDVKNPDTRDIADIVYFASAYAPEE